VPGLRAQQSQHGLMSPMNPIEVANGQGARWRQIFVMKSSKNSHEKSLMAKAVIKTGYIVPDCL